MNYEQKTISYKGKIVFEKIYMPYFKRIPKLFLSNEACFMFINKGEFSVRTPDQYISLEKGKGLLAKCFDYFFETNKHQRQVDKNIEVIGVLLHQDIVEELFQFDVQLHSHKVDYNVTKVPINGMLNNFKESINILIDNPDLADEAMVKNKLKEFILLISKTQNAPSELDFLSAMFKINSTEFRETINNNLYSNLSITEFASLCGMSISSFKRKFKETYNETPKKYILKMKLLKATQLLGLKDQRISDIAYDCGFETISTFNRAFRTLYGKSPSEFRMV